MPLSHSQADRALIPVVVFVGPCVLERLIEHGIRQRNHLLFRAFAKPLKYQVTAIGQREMKLKGLHLANRAAFGIRDLIELDDRVVLASCPHD